MYRELSYSYIHSYDWCKLSVLQRSTCLLAVHSAVHNVTQLRRLVSASKTEAAVAVISKLRSGGVMLLYLQICSDGKH